MPQYCGPVTRMLSRPRTPSRSKSATGRSIAPSAISLSSVARPGSARRMVRTGPDGACGGRITKPVVPSRNWKSAMPLSGRPTRRAASSLRCASSRNTSFTACSAPPRSMNTDCTPLTKIAWIERSAHSRSINPILAISFEAAAAGFSGVATGGFLGSFSGVGGGGVSGSAGAALIGGGVGAVGRWRRKRRTGRRPLLTAARTGSGRCGADRPLARSIARASSRSSGAGSRGTTLTIGDGGG